MAPYLGLTSLTSFPNSNQPQTHFATMRNNNQTSLDDEDDSWEVRAFEEDTTGNLLGCTWPPRSYTCTFCRREFRSAQALGGHMNVHRRDRARLHEVPPPLAPSPSPSPPPILIQTPHAHGLCLLYPFTNPNSIIFPNPLPTDYKSPLQHLANNHTFKPTETTPSSVVSSTNTEPSASNTNDIKYSPGDEELDLELRLGRRP